MHSPRWRKVLRDLWLYLPRTLLIISALTLGMVAVGAFLDAYTILAPTITLNFARTNPAEATLRTENADDTTIQIARHVPGVTAAVARRTVYARVETGSHTWTTLVLFVISDFNQLPVNTFWSQSGMWPPGDKQILIERASLPVVQKAQGDQLVVTLSTSAPQELPIVGVVFDPGQAPGWVDGVAYGYITPATLQWLGGPSTVNDLLVTFARDATPQAMQNTASEVAVALREHGSDVQWVQVELPHHPHADQMKSFLFLLEAFGVLCLLMSALLSATLMMTLLSQHIRQIGMMKAIGARTHQVLGLYIGMLCILSAIALVIALPLSLLAGYGFAQAAAGLLNFNTTGIAVPLWAYLVQVALGMLLPMLTALYPIYRGSRITVREAISDYGVAVGHFGTSRLDRLIGRIHDCSRPLALALRNAFRQRIRLVLTILMLTAGGASFIAALGAAASWSQTIDDAFATSHYDIDIRFDQSPPATALEHRIRALAGVRDVEVWGGVAAVVRYSDGRYGNGNLFRVLTPPETGTRLSSPLLIEGRWLQPTDSNAVVLNDAAAQPEQGVQVHSGDDITLFLNGKQQTRWHVVGITREFTAGPTAYMNARALTASTHQSGVAARALVGVRNHDSTLQRTVSQALEQQLAADGVPIAFLFSQSFERQVLANHVTIIQTLLLVVSILLLMVGAFGLAAMMSVNILERTREIGVMRAIGASTPMVMQMVMGEGIVISLVSWLLGGIVALPVTAGVSSIAGELFLHIPLHLVIPVWIPVVWLVVVLVVAVCASVFPAWRAAHLAVRALLEYA